MSLAINLNDIKEINEDVRKIPSEIITMKLSTRNINIHCDSATGTKVSNRVYLFFKYSILQSTCNFLNFT